MMKLLYSIQYKVISDRITRFLNFLFFQKSVLPRYVFEIEEISSTNIPQSPSIPSKVNDWSVEDVISWMKSLKLSKDYSNTIEENGVDGSALVILTEDDWKSMGITAVGDRRKIVLA